MESVARYICGAAVAEGPVFPGETWRGNMMVDESVCPDAVYSVVSMLSKFIFSPSLCRRTAKQVASDKHPSVCGAMCFSSVTCRVPFIVTIPPPVTPAPRATLPILSYPILT